ncbi:alpha/beta fold hydrolase [Phaeobacter italicus]|uniref:alpha/beta fold hydrolase n=1 Tax=Phaeobacter italicus TaxID=481446 RepID=UPI001C97024A|nr:alpha/beta hydrolase [Phaeobacter italicus]MBY6043666.1 alpha/beta hydrolase [Phaeobacter italicus]
MSEATWPSPAYFTTSDGLRLAYVDCMPTEPDGSVPLICLAGLTRDGQDFRYLLPHMTGRRLILLDARGRGSSDHADDFTTYAVPVEARDVIEMLDHLNIARAAVLGTSRGGMVAMVLAATVKERLAAVVLNDVGPEIPAGGVDRIMAYVGRRPAAKTHREAAEALSAHLGSDFPDVPFQRWLEEAQIFYEQTDDGLALRYDKRIRDALLAQAEAGPFPDLWPLFMALQGLPCGVIRGENSDILSRDTFSEMQRRLPELEAVEVANRGHVPFLDEPAALALIKNVLDQIE